MMFSYMNPSPSFQIRWEYLCWLKLLHGLLQLGYLPSATSVTVQFRIKSQENGRQEGTGGHEDLSTTEIHISV